MPSRSTVPITAVQRAALTSRRRRRGQSPSPAQTAAALVVRIAADPDDGAAAPALR